MLCPFHVGHAFHEVVHQDLCSASFLKDSFAVLHLLNFQHACLENVFRKKSVVCGSQRSVTKDAVSRMSYCLSSFVGIQKTFECPSSDRISNWLNFDVA